MSELEPNTSADGPDDATLAGEYVLGLLSEAERRAAERRIGTEPAFAALVESWTMRLQPLADRVPDVAPPPRVWAAIDARTGGRGRAGLWRSLSFWRAATLASSAAAVALVLFIGVQRVSEPPFVAAFHAQSQQPGFVAEVDPAGSRLRIRLAGVTAGPARVPELWVIPGDGRPRSLGVIAESRDSILSIPAAHSVFLTSESTLAVSLEPQGGSPTGLPTGPVVASGRLQKI